MMYPDGRRISRSTGRPRLPKSLRQPILSRRGIAQCRGEARSDSEDAQPAARAQPRRRAALERVGKVLTAWPVLSLRRRVMRGRGVARDARHLVASAGWRPGS
jgi:hypothetical protein